MRPYFEKNLSQKRAGGVAQGMGPEFKPQYHKKKKKKSGSKFMFLISYYSISVVYLNQYKVSLKINF
jgi:hypothetical protein